MTGNDPLLLADDLCELARSSNGAANERTLAALIVAEPGSVDGALAEVARRGFLGSLVATAAQSKTEQLLGALSTTVKTAEVRALICHEVCQLEEGAIQETCQKLLLSAGNQLPELFAKLIEQGDYEDLLATLDVEQYPDTPTLRALAAARPSYGMQQLNEGTIRRLLQSSSQTPYDLLIVPGFTPVDAKQPIHMRDLPAAESRVQLAAQDLRGGKAKAVFVTGGSVHPPGTPYNEALMMRARLLELGIAADQILIDPHARHSTTNLRNAGRMMNSLRFSRGLIVTGFERSTFSQAFYFAHAGLSTFALRCQRELGYSVGTLREVDDHHIEFTPSAAVATPSYSDPLDV